MAKVKCPYCKEQLDRESGKKIGNRYYHTECLEKKDQEENSKAKSTEKEKQELRELQDYLWFELYEKKVQFPFLMKQVKSLKDEHEYRYKGMELALRYHYDLMGNLMQEGHGIGIIPYVYEDAKKHYALLIENKKHHLDYEAPKARTVEIQYTKNKKNKIPLIDMKSL
ncbi:hypothetical protein [Bacillus sp. Marseille-P3800]|uniref:hypothetical protein n=1 Tax=Bacillus sp. Marseille-P3800 TaxID=2014782 RepID=UPI000C082C53|nr:hypothetical protein [Bacillus sp. Marseille-P3800]